MAFWRQEAAQELPQGDNQAPQKDPFVMTCCRLFGQAFAGSPKGPPVRFSKWVRTGFERPRKRHILPPTFTGRHKRD
jgi:hypothetical protein